MRRIRAWLAWSGVLAWVAAAGAQAGAEPDSCITCHRDPSWLVTERKLYDYYQDWERSIHAQEGVTCSDCHGGNREATTRGDAHRGMWGESRPESAVHFRNVTATCGSCHGDVEEAYRSSAHFEHLEAEEEGEQGPSCVTCHDSMNTLTLDVTSVEQACSLCHGDASGKHPEVPREARVALNRFLSIDRFQRYVERRVDSMETRLFLEGVRDRRRELSVLWHTFDLQRIDAETVAILEALVEKRDQLRAARGKEEGASASP